MATLFVVIAAGYLVGELNFKGFALGSGAVLFVGLACGAFAPDAAPPAMLGTLGLLLFLYCVGIQYGGEWYRGLTSPAGLRANAVALCGLAASAVAALAIQRTGAAGVPESLGMFAGATTNTPALQAVIDTLGNQDAAVGYSLGYPMGVAGPILCMYLYVAIFKPKIAAPADRLMKPAEVRVRSAALIGRPFADLQQSLPKGVRAVAIRSGGQNRVPDPTAIVRADDVVLLVGADAEAIGQAQELVGEAAAVIAVDRTALDYIRVFASRGSVVGMALGTLKLPGGVSASYIHVRRGDVDLLPADDLLLEFGDRVGVLCHRADFDAVRRFFGDSIKGVADFSYISLGVGVAMGLLLGLIPLPVPGLGPIRLGLAGVLLVALGLGHIRRTGGMVWTLPLSANTGTAKFRADGVPGAGRNRVRPEVRRDRGGQRIHADPARRHHHAGGDRRDHDCRKAVRNSGRRSVRHHLRGDWEPRHPGLRQPRRPYGAARHRLRDGVSDGDRIEDPVRADRREGPRQLTAARYLVSGPRREALPVAASGRRAACQRGP